MYRLIFSLIVLALGVPLCVTPSYGLEGNRHVRDKGAWQRGGPVNPENMERWRKLSPDRKRKVIERYRRWEKLPPNKRRMILRRYRRFKNLPKGEQKRLRRRWGKLKRLNPEERKSLRSFARKFRELPAWRKQHLKKEVRSLRHLSPEKRRSAFMKLKGLKGFKREEKLAFYRFTLEKWKSD